jgi:hypothetical protein
MDLINWPVKGCCAVLMCYNPDDYYLNSDIQRFLRELGRLGEAHGMVSLNRQQKLAKTRFIKVGFAFAIQLLIVFNEFMLTSCRIFN